LPYLRYTLASPNHKPSSKLPYACSIYVSPCRRAPLEKTSELPFFLQFQLDIRPTAQTDSSGLGSDLAVRRAQLSLSALLQQYRHHRPV
jgi:hypothetical protein